MRLSGGFELGRRGCSLTPGLQVLNAHYYADAVSGPGFNGCTNLLFTLAQLANWKQTTSESCSFSPGRVISAPDLLQFIMNYVLVYSQF